jgi:hypothetical protein
MGMYLCRTRYKCGNRTQPPPLLRSIWRLRQTTNERWPSREIRSVSGPFSMMPSFPLFMAARLSSSTGDAELKLVFVGKKKHFAAFGLLCVVHVSWMDGLLKRPGDELLCFSLDVTRAGGSDKRLPAQASITTLAKYIVTCCPGMLGPVKKGMGGNS